MDYSEMNVQQRAAFLLEKGVEAKIDMCPNELKLGYAAIVNGVGKLPCGHHDTEQAAIEAGESWLREKAKPSNTRK